MFLFFFFYVALYFLASFLLLFYFIFLYIFFSSIHSHLLLFLPVVVIVCDIFCIIAICIAFHFSIWIRLNFDCSVRKKKRVQSILFTRNSIEMSCLVRLLPSIICPQHIPTLTLAIQLSFLTWNLSVYNFMISKRFSIINKIHFAHSNDNNNNN